MAFDPNQTLAERNEERLFGAAARLEPDICVDVFGSMSDDPVDNMIERIERCRRLAKYVNDPRTTEALLEMAAQGEADVERLRAERRSNSEHPV